MAIIALLICDSVASLFKARDQAKALCAHAHARMFKRDSDWLADLAKDRVPSNTGWGVGAYFSCAGRRALPLPMDKEPSRCRFFSRMTTASFSSVASMDRVRAEELADGVAACQHAGPDRRSSMGIDNDDDVVFEFDTPRGAGRPTCRSCPGNCMASHDRRPGGWTMVANAGASVGKDFEAPVRGSFGMMLRLGFAIRDTVERYPARGLREVVGGAGATQEREQRPPTG